MTPKQWTRWRILLTHNTDSSPCAPSCMSTTQWALKETQAGEKPNFISNCRKKSLFIKMSHMLLYIMHLQVFRWVINFSSLKFVYHVKSAKTLEVKYGIHISCICTTYIMYIQHKFIFFPIFLKIKKNMIFFNYNS